MKKLLSLLLSFLLLSAIIVPTADAATRRRVVRTSEPEIIYVYQTVPNTNFNTSATYPGCGRSDIIIGGQAWASCNASTKSYGSTSRSGWFFANDMSPTFRSENGTYRSLEWIGKVTPVANWGNGPCAEGYRLPSRGEWETAITYSRYNGTNVAGLLNLPQNGGYRAYKDSSGDVRIEGRNNVAGSYWTSSYSYNGGYVPMLMNLGAVYQNYRLDTTGNTYNNSGYDWQYGNNWLELVAGNSTDIANVRCIRK